MSGNNENGGCVRWCGSEFLHWCQENICISPQECCLRLGRQVDKHIYRTMTIVVAIGIILFSWSVYSIPFSLNFAMYSGTLFYSAGITGYIKKGHFYTKALKEARKKELQRRRQAEEIDQPAAECLDGDELPPLDAVVVPIEVNQAPEVRPVQVDHVAADPEGRPVLVHHVEVYNIEQPNESSNLGEPASLSTDEPLQQAAASTSASGRNLLRSSTDPSTQSTSVTPSDVMDEMSSRTEF